MSLGCEVIEGAWHFVSGDSKGGEVIYEQWVIRANAQGNRRLKAKAAKDNDIVLNSNSALLPRR